MKKEYIVPEIEFTLVIDEDILAGSPSFEDGEVGFGDVKDRLQFDALIEYIDLFDY